MPEDRQAALALTDELVSIKAKLGQLGLFKTMHALNGATQAIGYEIAEKLCRTAPRVKP
jgi:hypothetical protein